MPNSILSSGGACFFIVAGMVLSGPAIQADPLKKCQQTLVQVRLENKNLKEEHADMAKQLRRAASQSASQSDGSPADPVRLKPLGPGERSQAGYAETLWGMSIQEVKNLYPKARGAKGGELISRQNVAEKPAVIKFRFRKDRLASVQVAFKSAPFESVKQLMDEYKEMEDLLGLKYGTAQADGSDKIPARAAEPTSLSRAVSQGRVHLTTTWEPALSRIVLSCDGEGRHYSMTIEYESKELLMAERQRLLKDL